MRNGAWVNPGIISTPLGLVILLLLPALSHAQDTLVVRSSGPPAWGEGIELVEELRIGALDGVEEEMFGSVSAVAILRDSSIWVADFQASIVRGFRADGSFVGNAGGPGEGPGEFRLVTGASGQPDGTLAVWDHFSGRMSVFDPDGEVRSSQRLPEAFGTGAEFRIDAEGHWFILTRILEPGDPPDGQPQAWIKFAPDGAVLDTIPVPSRDADRRGFAIAAAEGNLGPFVTETLHTLGNAGDVMTARNSEYAFHRPLPDGRILRVERDHEPVEIGAEEHRQWEAYRRHFAETVTPTLGLEAGFDETPRVKPAFRRIWSDAEGRLWIHRYVEAAYRPVSDEVREARGDRPVLDWREPTVHDLFAPDGAYLAQITLPPRTRIRAASGRHIWAQQAGEFGEAYIVRFRIEAPHVP